MKEIDRKVLWIGHGRPVDELPSSDSCASNEESIIRRHGLVKVTLSVDVGTAVSWAVFAPNWSSLFFVMESLHLYPAPYHLNYYLAGWFSETIADWQTARERIHSLIAKSDVHLLSRTYVKEVAPDPNAMPTLLQDAWGDRTVKPDYSIDCIHDDNDRRFKVMRIGPNSPIAKLWGIMPVSYPCLNGGGYDQVVSEIYPHVIETGEPHYGHVFAAMALPNRSVRWVPYQRVVLPHRFPDGRSGVTVVSQLSPVDIQVV